MWYDAVISILIIGGLLLIVASRVTKQTISDMLRGITDWIKERKDDNVERYLE